MLPACDELALGCHVETLEFHYREAPFADVAIDTGWVPAGSPLQVRFALFVGASTEVDLAGHARIDWPRPLTLSVLGVPGRGRLAIDYGIEVIARVRFDVEVAGRRYTWEGDIPTRSIPTDLRLAGETGFDPFLLPTAESVHVADTTERVPVVSADLVGLVGIPGVSGGFELSAQAALDVGYRTERLEIGDAEPIVTETGETIVGPDAGETGFGARKDVVVAPVGELGYDGVVGLYPTFFIEVVGRRFDMPLGSFDVPIISLDREAAFDPRTASVPLPDLVVGGTVDFGAVPVGERVEMLLALENAGDAPAHVAARSLALPFELESPMHEVPARSSRSVRLSFTPMMPGEASAMLFLDTDDPDRGIAVVRLIGVGEASSGDASIGADAGVGPGGSNAGGCACRARNGASSAPSTLLGLALVSVIALRRRARRIADRR